MHSRGSEVSREQRRSAHVACSLAFALSLLSACGGGASSTPPPPTGASVGESSGASSSSLGPDGCSGHDPAQASACEARGCRWGERLVCGGIEQPEERVSPRSCACACPEEMGACMRAP
ncbi:MAG: hypothetical protein U0353_31395 [Sandaracinus sp.]